MFTFTIIQLPKTRWATLRHAGATAIYYYVCINQMQSVARGKCRGKHSRLELGLGLASQQVSTYQLHLYSGQSALLSPSSRAASSAGSISISPLVGIDRYPRSQSKSKSTSHHPTIYSCHEDAISVDKVEVEEVLSNTTMLMGIHKDFWSKSTTSEKV